MNYRSGGSSVNRTPAPVMEYLKQIKIFTTFSHFFADSNRNDTIKIENFVFVLHSKATVIILMVGTMFLSMRNYFGEPIECLTRSEIPQALIQNYCWLEGSFSVVDSTGKAVVDNVAYPGVKTLNEESGEKRRSHKYYQWVYFVLILQSIMFYVPKYLWKVKEAKRLKNMIFFLAQRNIMEWNEIERRKLTQDVFDSILISSDYFFFFFFCEFLYFIHLIAQMWFINVFLSGQFLKLGWEWLFYSHNENQQDPLIQVFPRITKCSFHKYGYSGSIETHDALCFLTLNIVNEKLYTLLWFWFAFLFILTSYALINRIILILSPKYRYWKIEKLAPSTDKKVLKRLTSRVGNWFILFHLCKNMKPSHFRDLIDFLVKEHFDKNCNLIIGNNKADQMSINNINKLNNLALMGNMPMMNNKMMMAPGGQMLGVPSAPMQTLNTGSKKKSNKVNLKNPMYYGRTSNKPTNLISVNRDPPSGLSDGSQTSDECAAINIGNYQIRNN